MDDKMIISLIEQTLKEKKSENFKYIRYSFYELRIKYDLTEQETDRFLNLTRIRLQNEKYNVYFTGTKFEYNKTNMIVQNNELMIAIKE